MTTASADLLAFRHAVMAETGLTDPADVGIVGDGIHQRTGGYHEGRSVLAAIGRYHPGDQYIGAASEDYSARMARDRAGLTEEASAVDIGAQWPRGGRAAWLRFNRGLVAALQAGDPALSAIRAVNYSPDGVARHRIDRQYGFASVQDTTDSVDVHTHIEWYRDTAGQRQASLDRLLVLIRAARDNTQLTAGGADMEQAELLKEKTDFSSRTVAMLFGDLANLRNWLYAKPGATGLVNPPPAGSLGDLLAKFLTAPPAASAVLSDAQVATITQQIAAAVIANHDALSPSDAAVIEAAVGHQLAAAFSAGAAATTAHALGS